MKKTWLHWLAVVVIALMILVGTPIIFFSDKYLSANLGWHDRLFICFFFALGQAWGLRACFIDDEENCS